MSTIQEAIQRARTYAPYLSESLELYPDLASALKVTPPQTVFEDLVAELPTEIMDFDAEMSALRVLKRRAHLLIALADIAEVWDWVEVTEHLTRLADLCMSRLLRAAGCEAGIDGTPDNPVPGFFVLAVGKYGARELNYSSDIDFNVFYDPALLTLPNMARAERTLIKLVQSLIKGFERITGEGYIFRTDLRLRPDPRSNAVAVSTRTAERYYVTLGQNWERAAMIKARVCGGDYAAGQDFVDHVLSPFIWRRNLDYVAIDDILAIKRQIHAGKGGMDIHVPGHHLKLGKGGIREIEFYAQVQQLILGGRLPELRKMRTVDALAELAEGGFISPDDAAQMRAHYGVLRTYEHRAQMVADAQTHHVPEDDIERENFAKLCGFDHRGAIDADILRVLTDVHARYVDLFPDFETLSSREGSLVFTGVEPGPETLATFVRLGYARGPEVWQDMAGWLGGRIPATKTERAREYLTALAPRLIDLCADTGEPDRAFYAFARFFTAVKGGVSILSMFINEPERLAQLILLMSRSARIADRLAERPAILDAMADPDFLNIQVGTLPQNYENAFSEAVDFEEALNVARRCVREDHFRISAGVLTGHIEVGKAAGLFSTAADAAVVGLLPAAITETKRVSGPLRGDVAVIGLGKMGGREMRLTSDLDIMLVYKPSPEDETPQLLYTKVTQRLISALSAVTEEGGLFEVDMALRPSGRSGPVAVSTEAFSSYYQEQAWTWEFMALTRARIIAASSPSFKTEMEAILSSAVLAGRPDLNMPRDVADMLRRTKAEKPLRGPWDIKNMDGGQRDAEFVAQSFYLQNRDAFSASGRTDSQGMIDIAAGQGLLHRKQAARLIEAVKFYDALSQIMSMTGSETDMTPSAMDMAVMALDFESGADLRKAFERHRRFVTKRVHQYIFND